MAFFDNSLLLSNAQAITVTADSTTIYDVTGAGSGTAPKLLFGGTVFGEDIGAGEGLARPVAYFIVGTTFTAGGAATLQISVQAAPDNGSNVPGTYVALDQTFPIPVANLVSGAAVQLVIPPVPPTLALPRFYKFTYTVATGPMTAGTITGGIMLAPTNNQISRLYGSNFIAA